MEINTDVCACCNFNQLEIPGTCEYIRPGCRIRLGRFSRTTWVVAHDWYSWGGNRAVCGWFLINAEDSSQLKPLQLTDLQDVYLVEQ